MPYIYSFHFHQIFFVLKQHPQPVNVSMYN